MYIPPPPCDSLLPANAFALYVIPDAINASRKLMAAQPSTRAILLMLFGLFSKVEFLTAIIALKLFTALVHVYFLLFSYFEL
jgi:hypothetical protein